MPFLVIHWRARNSCARARAPERVRAAKNRAERLPNIPRRSLPPPARTPSPPPDGRSPRRVSNARTHAHSPSVGGISRASSYPSEAAAAADTSGGPRRRCRVVVARNVFFFLFFPSHRGWPRKRRPRVCARSERNYRRESERERGEREKKRPTRVVDTCAADRPISVGQSAKVCVTSV